MIPIPSTMRFICESPKVVEAESCAAVGEDTELTIEFNGSILDVYPSENVEFRLLSYNNKLVAVFPLVREDGSIDDWITSIDKNKLFGTLNLNTKELIDIFKSFGSVDASLPFVATLDYLEHGKRTNVFTTEVEIKHWQRVTMPDNATISLDEYHSKLYRLEKFIDNHKEDFNNPHKVTAKQIGAVDEDSFRKEINSLTSEYGSQIAENANHINTIGNSLNSFADILFPHINNTSNPHKVTAEQVGAYTKAEVDNKLSAFGNAINYQGTVDTNSDLPTNANRGDLYNVEDTGLNYIWDGNKWDELSPLIDLSGYVTKKDLNNHTNNYNNPHRITPEQIGALPTVDGIAENLKKKTITDTKTISFSWGTGSYGTIEAVFDEYGYLYEGLVDIGGNWVRNPQEYLSIYNYGSVPGLREDLSWYNVSCSDYVYPDENASDDNYNYVYNFYLGYDESNGFFVEVAFEMYVYNEETGEYEYEYIVEPCSSTPWEDIIIDSPVLSEYELLDEEGKIKSEKIPPYTENDPVFKSWRDNSTSIKAGKGAEVGSSYTPAAYGHYAKATGAYSVALGCSSQASGTSAVAIKGTASGSNGIAIGNSTQATSSYSTALGSTAKAITASYATALGSLTEASAEKSTAVGYKAKVSASGSVQLGEGLNETENSLQFRNLIIAKDTKLLPATGVIILGKDSTAGAWGIAIGEGAEADNTAVVIGKFATSIGRNIVIGSNANAGNDITITCYNAVAIGQDATVKDKYNVAIGDRTECNGQGAMALGLLAKATASYAIQLGKGTNATEGTLQFGSYPLVNKDGYIPQDRIVLVSPNGTKYKLVVADDGTLSTAKN